MADASPDVVGDGTEQEDSVTRDLFTDFATPPPPTGRRARMIAAALGAVLIAAATMFIRFHRLDEALKIEVQFDGYQFHITNRENAPLREIEIVLNDRYVPRWKGLPPSEIAPGETLRLPLAWFWRQDGVRFYLTDPVRHLRIRASVKGKRKSLARTYLSP